MRATPHRRMTLLSLGVAAFAASCGDSGPATTENDVLLFPDAVFDSFTPDTVQPTDTLPRVDSTVPVDTHTDATTTPDLIPDTTHPTIASTTPAEGATNVALPLTITIVFSEPISPNTIAPETIKVVDFNNADVPGTPTLGADGKTVTWRPTTNDQQHASPYTIVVGAITNVIRDLAGNPFDNTSRITFTTENYDVDEYQAVAQKYAPRINSAVELTGIGQTQVPTKLDSDGDWNLANNKDWLVQQATSLVPAVYYSVAETRTHYFIHYLLYFPWVNRDGVSGHANGTVGYLVTVEKARGAVVERPVSLHTWFREGTSEENLAFLTDESGLVRAGDPAKDWFAQASMPQATLFPDGHFTAWVTAKNHYACLWGTSVGTYCDFSSSVDTGNKLVFGYTNGAPTPYAKASNAWPKTMSEVPGTPEVLGYALIPALSSLWPRRFEKGADKIFDPAALLGPYVADGGRSVGAGITLPSKLLEPLNAGGNSWGRPFWSFGYNPGSGMASDPPKERFAAGQMGIDPAWYVWERHHSTVRVNSLVEYNASTGEGYSADYCFNGVAGIDVRGSAGCQ